MTDIQSLIRSRGQLKGKLTAFAKFIDNFQPEQLSELKLRILKIDDMLQQFEQVQDQVEILSEIEYDEDARSSFESHYFQLLAKAHDIVAKLSKDNSSTPSAFSQSHSRTTNSFFNDRETEIQLPILNLPSFSGQYEQWISFYETFNCLIDSNDKLTSIQKFYYLKSCLKNEAAQLIETLAVTSDNYKIALELLKSRFQNKRLIIKNHINALFNLEPVVKDASHSLRNLLDSTTLHLKVLKSLNCPTEHWDILINYIVVSKLDYVSKREWESSLTSETESFEQLTKFVERRCQLLESLNLNKSINHPKIAVNHKPSKIKNVTHVSAQQNHCPLCKENHFLFKCNDFLSLPVSDRLRETKKLGLCINCLKPNHYSNTCNSKSTCRTCHRRHNTLLHSEPQSSSSKYVTVPSINNHCSNQGNQILLSTAVVYINDQKGKKHLCRALLDVGSQANFISEKIIKQLGIKDQPIDCRISGVNSAVSSVARSSHISIQSQHSIDTYHIDCLVVPKVTNDIPAYSFPKHLLDIPRGIKLADNNFNKSSPIDLLLGADVFWDLLGSEQIKIGDRLPYLHNTKLGWIVGGPLNYVSSNISVCNTVMKDLNNSLTKFWEVEDIPEHKKPLSTDEALCENHFLNTHSRNKEGRFIVKFPFKPNAISLGDSYKTALNRLFSLENKFKRNPDIKKQYVNFMREYIDLHHMELIKDDLAPIHSNIYYLPHHPVIRESSTTTKLRVAFDASCKTSSNVSLNDNLLIGPALQQELFIILIRFRSYKFVLSADIVKMYRQIQQHIDDHDYQRILWRENPEDPILKYRLKTVTYGTASAPYLAIRCLHQLANDSVNSFPLAAKVLLNDFYVDDLLTGSNDLNELQNLQKQLIHLLAKGGFQLQKWSSNNHNLLKSIDSSNKDTNVYLNKENSTKILGLLWHSSSDVISFSINNLINISNVTKRIMVSKIAQIFDPLGLIGPVIINAKVLIQQLWREKLDWDDHVPLKIKDTWISIVQQFPLLKQLSIQRDVVINHNAKFIEIHGFSDASEMAYGACIYIRTSGNNGTYFSNLLCSKSKVTPLKTLSIPRLELCGALLLARLCHKISKLINLNSAKIYLWTDSQIVLSWLLSQSKNWRTFVANRVGEIQSLTNISSWQHVSSKDNPADLISRGCSISNIINSSLWWHGPEWLTKPNDAWPKFHSMLLTDIPEKRANLISHVAQIEHSIFTKYSSFLKLQRTIAIIVRFFNNLKYKSKTTGPLTVSELDSSHNLIIKHVQSQSFFEDIQNLKNHKPVHRKSNLSQLNPFLDGNGICRVGGRLKKSNLSFNSKHPILLPRKHHITYLIIKGEHERVLHAGQQTTLFTIRQNYWPIGGRSIVKDLIHKCMICYKYKPKFSNPLMGDLPRNRLAPTRPFLNSGLDYAGPFNIKTRPGRCKTTQKAYIALFVCFATKAYHIELVTDLSAETFLNALKRFISRRGHIQNLYSDNATNFVGAQNELKKLLKSFYIQNKELITSKLSEQNITWHFIPPRAPHFGGLWEAGIKSVKQHLIKIINDALLTYEELYTLLTRIEAVLNSRPLFPVSTDPNDLIALTPAHFLIRDSLTAPVEPSLVQLKENTLSRWQRVEQMHQHFWKRWHHEYLNHLQQRSKWTRQGGNPIKIGSLVLIKEDNLPPFKWAMGRVTTLHPGTDNIVRVVSIKTKNNNIKRAVTKLCVLPQIDT